ncbi:biotin--[acetyl-CoA-carboxylase] ligase [Actibacterium sp. 188UL27-1]|nr:biotin--[acetyl-CoA-carboxylase] ligase [Actibacterium sp. 188UL27-1]
MAEAARRRDTLTGPTWILARNQIAAHGRRGRPWSMPPGNFAATLVMQPKGDPAQAALRSFTAAVALYQALAMLTGPKMLSLKWPNDVLLKGGKVAGILLESAGQGGGVDHLSIGIGVNLASAPDGSQVEDNAVPPISVVGAGGKASSPEDFLFWLASHFADLEQQFQQFGFDPIRHLWLKHAARLGEVITARLPSEQITGTFTTIDAEGHLILNTAKGERRIAAAEIYF